MSSPPQIEEVFFGALDQQTASERASFLAVACGEDAELRRAVNRLLDVYPEASNFMAYPAIRRQDAGSTDVSIPLWGSTTLGAFKAENGQQDALSLLQPSQRPGSLGRLGHYEVLEVIGNGSFGTVVKAFDEKLHRQVAIKIMSPLLAALSTARARFLREARWAAAVRQENVVAIYAVEEQPIPYLVMEYIAGQTLQQKLDQKVPFDIPTGLRIAHQIACGLAAAHASGLIHRDIKPGNILLDSRVGPEHGVERVTITDFGLARSADDTTISQMGFIAGTPMYMAPEQALGETIDQRADMFSLGSVLYVLFSGQPPFRAASTLAVLKRVTESTPRPIREMNPAVPDWLSDLIRQLHAKNPAERLGSARELADLLARRLEEIRIAGSLSTISDVPYPGQERLAMPSHSPPTASPVTQRHHSRRRIGIAIAAAVFLIFVGGFAIAEATGVTTFYGTLIRLFAPEGTLVVEVDDPGISVKLDGSELVITGAGPKEIRLKPGRYELEASKDGEVVRRELITVTKNQRRIVRVIQEGLPAATELTKVDPPQPTAKKSDDQMGWERSVSGLTAAELVKAVAARLQELNPRFDGNIETVIERGAITGLKFHSDFVTDISPLRVLTSLKALECPGSDAFATQQIDASVSADGQVKVKSVRPSEMVDLSPLRGLSLTRFNCTNSQVNDLSPLEGMPLTWLSCSSTRVSDLSPVKGMPLVHLDCAFTNVSSIAPLQGMHLTEATLNADVADLTPLKGMPLVRLLIGRAVTDLSPLKGLPLEELDCMGAAITDLSPLRGMPLTLLACGDTKVTDITSLREVKGLRRLWCCDLVSDLSPLQGLPLEYLHAGPLVSDLSPLRGTPLKKLEFMSFQAERDADVLRSITTLEEVNDLSASEFWKRVEAANLR